MLEIEECPLEDLQPSPGNPRTHSEQQLTQLADIIKEYGFLVPILADDKGNIIAGEARWRAAPLAGLKSVPVIRTTHLNPIQKRAYMLADNKVYEMGGWDKSLLRQGIKELEAKSYNLMLTGISPEEINRLLKGSIKPTERPEVEFSRELLLEHNYVVLYFDNPLDWQVAIDRFGLAKVKDLIPRKGQPAGIGRVLPGAKWLKRFK